MKLDLLVFDNYCMLKRFFINNIKANESDFGIRIQYKKSNYPCENTEFVGLPINNEVLDYYRITEDEYNEIVNKLIILLSSKHCGLCE